MKSIISKAMMLVAFAAALLSFSPNFGGEGFEISLNGKVLLQQFGKDINAVKTLHLENSSPNDKLTIKYYHCGRVGKNRIVTIKDGQDKVIKAWKFSDTQNSSGEMTCSVQDITSLKKGGTNTFRLYYSSSELPGGRMLASVTVDNSSMVSRK